jgi:Uncharacterised nucleotidyltransferase
LDHLPPSIADEDLLALLGRILETDPTPESTSELRLRFFQPGFSWQGLVNLAVAQDVLPALIFSLKQRSLLPPVPATAADDLRTAHVTHRLEAAYRRHLERQADLRQQLLAVVAALNRRGIVPALLKGAVHLTSSDPPWQEARSMRDIDILVPPSEAPNANAILQSIGYCADPEPPPLDRHLPELRFPGRCGTIEIHTQALAFSARSMLTTEEVWRDGPTPHRKRTHRDLLSTLSRRLKRRKHQWSSHLSRARLGVRNLPLDHLKRRLLHQLWSGSDPALCFAAKAHAQS